MEFDADAQQMKTMIDMSVKSFVEAFELNAPAFAGAMCLLSERMGHTNTQNTVSRYKSYITAGMPEDQVMELMKVQAAAATNWVEKFFSHQNKKK